MDFIFKRPQTGVKNMQKEENNLLNKPENYKIDTFLFPARRSMCVSMLFKYNTWISFYNIVPL